jgi:hypothetical protein
VDLPGLDAQGHRRQITPFGSCGGGHSGERIAAHIRRISRDARGQRSSRSATGVPEDERPDRRLGAPAAGCLRRTPEGAYRPVLFLAGSPDPVRPVSGQVRQYSHHSGPRPAARCGNRTKPGDGFWLGDACRAALRSPSLLSAGVLGVRTQGALAGPRGLPGPASPEPAPPGGARG